MIIEIIELVAQIAVTLALIPAIYQLYLSRKIAKASLEREMKEATIMFTHEVVSEANKSRKIILDKFGTDTVNITDERFNQEVKSVILDYLNLVERLAVGINTEVYDYDILRRICGRKLVRAWNQYYNIVEYIRKEKNHQDAYIEYEALVARLRDDYKGITDNRGNIENQL